MNADPRIDPAGRRPRHSWCLALLAAFAASAQAQVDCSAGFNCGRVAWGEYVLDGAQSYRLWTQDLDGSNRSLLLSFGPGSGNYIQGLTFDAASRKLYFRASQLGTFDTNLFSINVDGTGLTSLTNDQCFNREFSISPDGARIVFGRNCGPNDLSDKIWLMNIDGSGQRILTTAPPVSSDPTGNKHADGRFSPSGNSVVFTSQDAAFGSRQVYRSSLDGLSVVALTDQDTDGFANDEPVYLPNGDIVFLSGRDPAPDAPVNDLYRMDGNGSGRLRLTQMPGGKSNLVVSPDGTRVLFVNRLDPQGFTVPPEVHVAKTDGTGVVTLYNEPAADRVSVVNARFSPDGSRIAFGLCTSLGGDCRHATRVVDLDGGNPVTYEDPAETIPFQAFGRPDVDGDGVIDGADSCPQAPNGYRVAVELATLDVWTMNYDGSQPLRVTTHSAFDRDPRFDPTGRRIVFSSNRYANDYGILVMNADGSAVTRLTNVTGRDEQPVISPDGTRIAFLGTRPELENYDQNVWIMNADGSNPIRLTTNQGFDGRASNPVFNHDGSRIAFDTVRNLLTGNNREIYTIRTDGSDEIRLTTTAGIDMEPAYSRDGASIVFISYRDGAATNGEIYLMRPDGSDPRRITNTSFREFRPTFSPDGAQIVFMADYDGSAKPYVMNRDGTGLRRITNTVNYDRPTLAPQPDSDGDGVGDACDPAFDAPTPVGSNVPVPGPGGTTVGYSGVGTAGTTTFTVIQPDPGELPQGFALCATCTAYDISTTASYTPPITVCLAVPAALSPAQFLQLRLLHGENGVYVDRTSFRTDEPGQPRQVCGLVNSLSPFALATQTALPDGVFGDGFEEGS